MKKINSIRFAIFAIVIAFGLTSCEDEPRPTTTIAGQIINSQTGTGLANALLSFYETDLTTAAFTTTTDASGFYNTTEAFIGTFTLVITAANYYDQTIPGFVISEDILLNSFSPITVVRTLGATDGVLRIVLTWGQTPGDLDTHLTGPIAGSTSRFHMYYSNKTPNTTVVLDVDETSSYGPETTTIKSWVTGNYRFSVQNFSDRTTTGSAGMFTSPAQVRVYNTTGLIKTYTAPAATAGDTWLVFEVNVANNVATIVDKGTYSLVGSGGTVTK